MIQLVKLIEGKWHHRSQKPGANEAMTDLVHRLAQNQVIPKKKLKRFGVVKGGDICIYLIISLNIAFERTRNFQCRRSNILFMDVAYS